MKLFKKIFFAFVFLIASYCVLLTITFVIPQHSIESNAEKSLQMVEKEGMYPSINQGNMLGTRLDNFTDHLMIRKTKADPELNPLENAMSMADYPRYWHGYQLFLLIGLTSYFLIKRSDIYLAIALLISLVIGNAAIFFFSMQFSNIWILTLLSVLLFLTKPQLFKTNQQLFLYFFVIGSLANFFDLLTTPVISWGIPVIIIYYVTNKYLMDKRSSLSKQVGSFVFTGIFWGLGYGLTWVTKWILSSIILNKNIVKDAINQILFRTEGNDKYPLHRLEMLKSNIRLMYPKVAILLLLITCLVFLYFAYRKRNSWHPFQLLVLFVLAAVTPYIWYNILANHSQIHYWFTYRTQIITSFAILSAFAFLIPPDKSKDELNYF